MAVVDLEKVHDNVNREKLWRVQEGYGVEERLYYEQFSHLW